MFSSSTMRMTVSGSCSLGFKTTVLPPMAKLPSNELATGVDPEAS